MRRLIYFFTVVAIPFSVALVSCEKDDNGNNCNVSDPAEDLEWLKQEIDNIKQDEYAYYVMAKYKGQTVFYNGNCNPTINYASIVKNCDGDSLGYTNDLYDRLTELSVLWKHENSKCDLDF